MQECLVAAWQSPGAALDAYPSVSLVKRDGILVGFDNFKRSPQAQPGSVSKGGIEEVGTQTAPTCCRVNEQPTYPGDLAWTKT